MSVKGAGIDCDPGPLPRIRNVRVRVVRAAPIVRPGLVRALPRRCPGLVPERSHVSTLWPSPSWGSGKFPRMSA